MMSIEESFAEISAEIINSKKFAEAAYERRLFVIIGRKRDKLSHLIKKLVDFLLEQWPDNGGIILTSNYKKLRQELKAKYKTDKLTIISNWDTDIILGRTIEFAVLDLRDWPDVISLSRVLGTVRGGGIAFIFLPKDYETKTYYEEIVPPYFSKPPRQIMLRRFLKKSTEARGIYLYDIDYGEFLWKPEEEIKHHRREEISIPMDIKIPKEIYELAASKDQVRAIDAIASWSTYIILLANRGRGKSASIGLGLTGYAYVFAKKHKRPLYICLTSRSKLNVEEIFKFAEIAHKALGIDYEYNRQEATFKSNVLRLEFEFPHRALKLYKLTDGLVIDEVAAIPFPILQRAVKLYKKIIFSGTVHGYEGTGRIFAVRFLDALNKMGAKFVKVELETPIRYAKDDPIELWLFDLLLLDAEPVEVSEEILENVTKAKLIELNPEKYFLGGSKEEQFLRNLIGILTTAHYRNNPKDLLLMSDAPHHRMFALVIDNIPLVALQVAEEGGIPERYIQEMLEEAPSGHLIPDNITRYTGLIGFPVKRGLRIVRIATHPRLQGHGLGSLAIKKLVDRAIKEKMSWIGASFGANPRLIRFWLKNRFLVANMSPMINPKTGEYSAIVIRPIDRETTDMVRNANIQLKTRLLRELRNLYWELEPETALQILKYGDPIDIIPQLNSGDVFRLGLYIRLGGKLEACIDVVDEITRLYFARKYDFLREDEELILIRKISQRRLIDKEDLPRIRKIVAKLWERIIRARFEAPQKQKKSRSSS